MNKGGYMNKDNSKLFTPTSAVLNNHQRGQALAKKHNKDVKTLVKNLTRVKPVEISKSLTLDDVKSLYNFLTKIEPKVDLRKAMQDGSAPSETIAWYLHGGSAALAWSRMILKSEGILKSHKTEITEEEINKEDNNVWTKTPVIKALDEKLKQATFVVLQPDVVDAHGDIYDANEIRKAKESFNKACMRANLFHMMETDTFEFIESYLTPADMIVNGEFVSKGSWLCTIQAHDDQVWAGIESGEINGVSIGCSATVEYLENENE